MKSYKSTGDIVGIGRFEFRNRKNGKSRLPRPPKGKKLLMIPLELIRPFPNQPRHDIDFEKVKGLAGSISMLGQLGPASVIPIKDGRYKYEFIDGERRYHACKVAGLDMVLAIVEENIKPGAQQYKHSAAMNFCRENHTPIESALVVKDLLELFGWSYKESESPKKDAVENVMLVCGKSVTWVRQHLVLLRLCPEVQEMLKNDEIPFQVGVALASFNHENQREKSAHIVDHELTLNQALHYIRLKRNKKILLPGGRMRGPSDDYHRLRKFIDRSVSGLDLFLDMPLEKFRGMFKNRSPKDLETVVVSISEQIDQLTELRKTLREIKVVGGK